jgi:hypothetical protein
MWGSYDCVLRCVQQVNVGDRVKEPQFIRALMTAVCQSAIESKCSCNTSFIMVQHNQRLKVPDIFVINYINRYSDENFRYLVGCGLTIFHSPPHLKVGTVQLVAWSLASFHSIKHGNIPVDIHNFRDWCWHLL